MFGGVIWVGRIVSQRLIEAYSRVFLVVLNDGDIAIFVVGMPMLAAMPDDSDIIGLLKHLEAAARIARVIEHIGGVAETVGPAAAGQIRFRNLQNRLASAVVVSVAIEGGTSSPTASKHFLANS